MRAPRGRLRAGMASLCLGLAASATWLPARSGDALVVQDGSFGEVRIEQSLAPGGHVQVEQHGTRNRATVLQVGGRQDTVTLLQSGFGNAAVLTQATGFPASTDNLLSVRQSGTFGWIDALQSGTNATGFLVQSSAAVAAHGSLQQAGAGSSAAIVQGADAAALRGSSVATGIAAARDAQLPGAAAQQVAATILQFGGAGLAALVVQSGTGASASIVQSGAYLEAQILQSGAAHAATVTQSGAGTAASPYRATVYQAGATPQSINVQQSAGASPRSLRVVQQ